MDAATIEIAELRTLPDWQSLLVQVYHDLYHPAFHENEREELADWQERLSWATPVPPQPFTIIHLAGRNLHSVKERQVVGLCVIELYQQSACALLTYIVVHDSARRLGVARRLFNAARESARELAEKTKHGELRAIFAELMADDESHAETSFTNGERVATLGRLGAAMIPVPYVQPALSKGKARSYTLKLLAFPPREITPRTIPADVIVDFMREFYSALGVSEVDSDTDFLRLKNAATSQRVVPLKGICCGIPALRFNTFGVAFHFVLPPSGKPIPAVSSPEFASFERDLLAFAFREAALFRNVSVPLAANFNELDVHFPQTIEYEAEGGNKILFSGDAVNHDRRRVRLNAAKTVFRDGTEIGHLILTNLIDGDEHANSSLDEWDLVKLIKLWERGEQRGTAATYDELIRFVPSGSTANGHSIGQLAATIFGNSGNITPRTGTVQLITEDESDPSRWNRLFSILNGLSETSSLPRECSKMPDFMAVGGIVHGLMDFPYVDAEELQEALEAAESTDCSLLGIHKGTLYYFTEGCRAFRSVQDVVGISPYLLFPQAVLTYNDHLLAEAERYIAAPRQRTSRRNALLLRLIPAVFHSLPNRMKRLSRTEHQTRGALQKRFMPDVFHYPAEHFLYRWGHESRGLNSKKASLLERIEEIHSEYEELRATHQFHVEIGVAILALFIAVLQMIEVFL